MTSQPPPQPDNRDDEPDEVSGESPGEGNGGHAPGDHAGNVPVALPDDMEAMPPGPLLGELLDELPVTAVSGFDTVTAMSAAYRQLAYQQVVFFEALVETGLRAPGSVTTVRRLAEPSEFSCEEARAALRWSRTRASRQYALAYDLCVRLPELGKAMKRGELDLPRATAFIDWTDGLTDAQAGQVCAHLLPQAAGLTVGELIDQIKRACLAIDPDWAERRYRNAVRRRRVAGFRNPEGTATLAAYDQPVDRVAAACARIDGLAKACKRAGDRRPIDHIRSDLFLGMADGTFEGYSDQQIINHVLAHPYVGPDDTDSDDTGGDNDGGKGSDGGGSGRGDTGGGNGGGGGNPGQSGSHCDQPLRREQSARGPAPDRPDGPGSVGPGAGGRRPDGPGSDGPSAGEPAAGRPWAAPEVRVGLATVLGWDEQPGDLPGWGPIPAQTARELVARMHAAEWRWIICDPRTGRPVAGGLLTARPTATDKRVPRDTRRGGIVELAVTSTDLEHLANHADDHVEGYATWAPVITSILAAYTRWCRETNGLADRAGEVGSGFEAGFHGEANRRAPGARLRRWIQLRDRQCPYPGCRAPAAASDIDHRLGYDAGGSTTPENLHPPCRHDHRVKHDGRWSIHPAPDGATVWVSPLGHRHTSRPPPVLPPSPPQSPRRHDPKEGSDTAERDPPIFDGKPSL